MQSYLISVPRTGTRFLMALIKPDWFNHVHGAAVPDRLEQADVIIAPIRDPLRTWNTWRAHDCRRLIGFDTDWALLDRYAGEYPVHVIPVDKPELRDAALAKLAKVLGREIVTDWQPVGSYAKPRPPWETPDLSHVYSLPVVARFYAGALSGPAA